MALSTGARAAIAVAVGGAAGSILRWWTQGLVQRFTGDSFPWGTFVVNVSGGFAIGFLATISIERGGLGPVARAGILVGLLGGFTTFSAYLFESDALLRDGRIGAALGNLLGSVLAGLAALLVGVALARLAVYGGRA